MKTLGVWLICMLLFASSVTTVSDCFPCMECCESDGTFSLVGSDCGDPAAICSDSDTCDGAGYCHINDHTVGTSCGTPDADVPCTVANECDGSGVCIPLVAVADISCSDGNYNIYCGICYSGGCIFDRECDCENYDNHGHWQDLSRQTFIDYEQDTKLCSGALQQAVNGLSAQDVCCVCGGGDVDYMEQIYETVVSQDIVVNQQSGKLDQILALVEGTGAGIDETLRTILNSLEQLQTDDRQLNIAVDDNHSKLGQLQQDVSSLQSELMSILQFTIDAVSTTPTNPTCELEISDRAIVYQGGEWERFKSVETLEACCALCVVLKANNRCYKFSFKGGSAYCYIFRNPTHFLENRRYISSKEDSNDVLVVVELGAGFLEEGDEDDGDGAANVALG